MMTPDTFAGRLRTLRESAGMTRYRLAKAANLTQTALDSLERGADPKLSTVERLARALGVRVRDLVDPD